MSVSDSPTPTPITALAEQEIQRLESALAAMTAARDEMEKERDVALRLLNEDGATLLTLRQHLTESQQQAQALREKLIKEIDQVKTPIGDGRFESSFNYARTIIVRHLRTATPSTPERTR